MHIGAPYSGLAWNDLAFLLVGAWHTILLTVVAGLAGTAVGVAIGWAREDFASVRIALALPVDVIRSVPLIIQFILVNSLFSISGVAIDPLWVGVITLSVYMGVLTSELVRAGLRSVPKPLRAAARSLSLTYWQELGYVAAPLGLRAVLPGLVGTLIALVKDSALVSVVGYVELLRASQILITRTNQALLILAGAGVFYFLICYPVSLYSRRIERSLAK